MGKNKTSSGGKGILAVEYPRGEWAVPDGFEISLESFDAEKAWFVSAPPSKLVEQPDGSLTPPERYTYQPSRMGALFIEFATVVEQGPVTPETVREFVSAYGILGEQTYQPDTAAGYWHSYRSTHQQSVSRFTELAREANTVLRLWDAATRRGSADFETLLRLGAKGETGSEIVGDAKHRAVSIVNSHLRRETVNGARMWGGFTFGWGPVAVSLLGHIFMLGADYLSATPDEIRRCKRCKSPIDFPTEEPPVSTTEFGHRRKRKRRSDREFCEYKNGKKDACKNAWNYRNRDKKV